MDGTAQSSGPWGPGVRSGAPGPISEFKVRLRGGANATTSMSYCSGSAAVSSATTTRDTASGANQSRQT